MPFDALTVPVLDPPLYMTQVPCPACYLMALAQTVMTMHGPAAADQQPLLVPMRSTHATIHPLLDLLHHHNAAPPAVTTHQLRPRTDSPHSVTTHQLHFVLQTMHATQILTLTTTMLLAPPLMACPTALADGASAPTCLSHDTLALAAASAGVTLLALSPNLTQKPLPLCPQSK